MNYSVVLTNDRLMLLDRAEYLSSNIMSVEFEPVQAGTWPFNTFEYSVTLQYDANKEVLDLLYLLKLKGDMSASVVCLENGTETDTVILEEPFISSIELGLPFDDTSMVRVNVIFKKATSNGNDYGF
jgi:hypothetical protein